MVRVRIQVEVLNEELLKLAARSRARPGLEPNLSLGKESVFDVDVTVPCYEKLKEMYRRQRATQEAQPLSSAYSSNTKARKNRKHEDDEDINRSFHARLATCLLRYHSLGGVGFQAGLGANVFRELQRLFGCNFEAFASPLNCFYGPHCSAFADTDSPFGSRGSFATFAPCQGSYQVNPPFVPAIIDHMAEKYACVQRVTSSP